jgi:hypothetical protein
LRVGLERAHSQAYRAASFAATAQAAPGRLFAPQRKVQKAVLPIGSGKSVFGNSAFGNSWFPATFLKFPSMGRKVPVHLDAWPRDKGCRREIAT